MSEATARRVVLFGMKHCGKSTLGRELARLWSCPFRDTDEAMEDLLEARWGTRLSVREIYARLGAEGFAAAEAQALSALAASAGRGALVVAAGGRTPLNPLARPVLRSLGLAVFLDVPAEKLWRRVLRAGVPPFLDPADPESDFYSLVRSRDPEYRAFADLVVTLDAEAPVGENVERLAKAIDSAAEGGEASSR